MKPAPRVLIFGADGQVGSAFLSLVPRQFGADAVIRAMQPKDADFRQEEAILASLDGFSPDLVLNAAAYTAVDRAEQDVADAFAVNAAAPGLIGRWCASSGARLVHFSTDYVYDGSGSRPWRETDPTGPLNAYGRSKLEGDRAVLDSGARALIFRTSWVYDSRGKNFLTTMLKLGAERERLDIVDDQIGAPTFALDLARGALQAIANVWEREPFPAGVYHLCNAGAVSWLGFANEIFNNARALGVDLKVKDLRPILSSDYPTTAKRPLNSRLDCRRADEVLHVALPPWREGLKACMNERARREIK